MPIKINIIEILTVGIEISFIFGDSLSYLLGLAVTIRNYNIPELLFFGALFDSWDLRIPKAPKGLVEPSPWQHILPEFHENRQQ